MTRERSSVARLTAFGASALISLAISTAALARGDFTVLHSFYGKDGANPFAGLILDPSQNLYGTTAFGGKGCHGRGCGTVFKMTRDGVLTVIYKFQGGDDGYSPFAGSLARDADGTLYGSTTSGGNGCEPSLCGTIFKVTPDGVETVLHAFTGGEDGNEPYGGVAVDDDGNVYGTTLGGGDSTCNAGRGCGVVFKIAPDGGFSVLHAFTGGADGAGPEAGLRTDGHGTFYGTTRFAGTGACQIGPISGCGVVFAITGTGQEAVLYTFQDSADGAFPQSPPIVGPDGNLYGTTYFGGESVCACGTIYKLTLDGIKTVLHTFQGGKDGANPYGGVLFDKAGVIYGTTEDGGNHCLTHGVACGSVYSLGTDGSFQTLHVLDGLGDGQYADSVLTIDSKGYLYGTGSGGGNRNCIQGCGTVFRLKAKQ